MADGTHIEWTDATWNPITGCAIVSPGCTNCYAMRLAGTRLAHHPSRAGLTRDSKAGPVWTGEVRFNEQWLMEPLRWKRPRMIFVCAHGDLFADGVEDEWLDRIFAVMALAPQHVFQVLTKRPERMFEYLAPRETLLRIDRLIANMTKGTRPDPATRWPLPNVWLGVSVEDQRRADERIPILLDTPAAVRWISAEPLLGPVDLTDFCNGHYFFNALTGHRWHDAPEPYVGAHDHNGNRLDWIVVGGESGRGARPMHPDWARSLRDQCAAAGVPFFFKQWGEWRDGSTFGARAAQPERRIIHRDGASFHPDSSVARARERDFSNALLNPTAIARVGKKASGRMLDGRTHDAMPGARR